MNYYTTLSSNIYSPIPREEEARLVLLVQASGSIQPVPIDVADARCRLMQANLRFVVRVAQQYASLWSSLNVSLEDLVEEGNLGLYKAIERFDLSKDCKLISYAIYWIKERIRASIAKHERWVNTHQPLPTYSRDTYDTAIDHGGIEDVSDEGCLEPFQVHDVAEIEQAIEADFVKSIMDVAYNILSKEELLVMCLYFRVNSPFRESLTLADIGQLLGKTASRIGQIKDKAIGEVRAVVTRPDF